MHTRLRASVLWTLGTSGAILVLGLVTSALLARWLKPEGRGELAAAMLWPVLLGYLGNMGLVSAALYYTASPPSEGEAAFANGMVLALLQSLILVPLGAVLLPWLLANQTPSIVMFSRWYLLLIPISLAAQYSSAVLQGRMQMGLYNATRLVIPVGYLVAVSALGALGRVTVPAVLMIHGTLNGLALAATLAALRRSGAVLRWRPELPLLRRMFHYGLRVYVGDLAQTLNQRLDQVLIATWLTPAHLGLYVVAVNTAGLSQALSLAVRTVVSPRIARAELPGERAALLRTLFHRYWLWSILATVLLTPLALVGIPVIFGPEFRGSVWPAAILLAGGLFLGAKDVLAGGTQAMGNPWLRSRAELAVVALNLALLALLVPWLGILGAACASLGAAATQVGLLVWQLRRAYGLAPLQLLAIRFEDLRAAARLAKSALASVGTPWGQPGARIVSPNGE